ncbi:ArsR family transcriptional regulator [Streptomyces sp. NPDC001380]|uniref:ArsR/SmtB family transcription factor n=1 Tax=Streptomyces sp. NPDC001380 TaxID=3364566 RepID=UPI00369D25E9
MLRIRLAPEDVARLRLAPAGVASPIEAMYSVIALRDGAGGPRDPGARADLRRWRARMRPRTGPETAPLLDLLGPGTADLPAFLLRRTGDMDAYLDAVASAPAAAVADQVRALYAGRRPSPYVRDLAGGDRAARTALTAAVGAYYRGFAADWPALRETAAADLAERSALLAREGVGAVLDSLHPAVRWRPPVLEIHRPGPDRDLDPGGRPVVLVPALFLRGRPRVLAEPDGPVFVTYPARGALRPEPGGPPGPAPQPDPLADALGRTRAEALRALRHGRTTTELAAVLAVSPASASEHAAVLRRAGLAATRREGRSVRHTATPLGLALLGADPSAALPGPRPASGPASGAASGVRP